MGKFLDKKFFERSAVEVAEELIGKQLAVSSQHRGKKIIQRFLITETEAYEGIEDLASHASKGRTGRAEVMFGEPGIFYVYLVYGMHHMLNVVTGPKNHPAAVLIRGLEGISGPGKITKILNINKSFNGKIASPQTGLWLEDQPKKHGHKILDNHKISIKRTPRIGVAYAGPVWSKKLWRFTKVLS